MKLSYTASFLINTTGVDIKTAFPGDTAGDNIIPNTIKVHAIALGPNDAAKGVTIMGTEEGSEWVTQPVGLYFTMEQLGGVGGIFMRVKAASGTETVTLLVKGD